EAAHSSPRGHFPTTTTVASVTKEAHLTFKPYHPISSVIVISPSSHHHHLLSSLSSDQVFILLLIICFHYLFSISLLKSLIFSFISLSFLYRFHLINFFFLF